MAEAEARLGAAHAEPWGRVMKAWRLFTGLDQGGVEEEAQEDSKGRGVLLFVGDFRMVWYCL